MIQGGRSSSWRQKPVGQSGRLAAHVAFAARKQREREESGVWGWGGEKEKGKRGGNQFEKL